MDIGTDCVGVDGAKSGWIAVFRLGSRLGWSFHSQAGDLVDSHAQARVIAVDIPIGLPQRNGRQADFLARKFVGGKRASSVFSAPVRGILGAASQPEASRMHRMIDGRGFGAQSFAILSKIREWDCVLQSDSRARRAVYEIHPEVSFAAMNGGLGNGLAFSKRKPQGHAERVELLANEFGSACVERLLGSVPKSAAAKDDVLDGLVALWSAERISRSAAMSLPCPPVADATGLLTAIWY